MMATFTDVMVEIMERQAIAVANMKMQMYQRNGYSLLHTLVFRGCFQQHRKKSKEPCMWLSSCFHHMSYHLQFLLFVSSIDFFKGWYAIIHIAFLLSSYLHEPAA
mmetsp:Transcript_25375/g.40713  ORF Transcript_25375/g.40713 Transcript_25375/m.40713 type:complete len:105 (-) Transcript_25375:926-1240(-)